MMTIVTYVYHNVIDLVREMHPSTLLDFVSEFAASCFRSLALSK